MSAGSSRSSKSFYTMVTGLAQHFLTLLLGFATRTVFIKTLGVRYLGVNGLFTNILLILSIADLGIGVAMAFYLYKPLAEADTERLASLFGFYKTAYRIIGMTILVMGLSLMPILHRLVKMEQMDDINLHLIYFLFLLNTVSTYLFFAYRSAIIRADQKGYLLNGINSLFAVISNVVEIIILIVSKHFILVLLVRLGLSISKNLFIAQTASRLYPFIKQRNHKKLDTEEIRNIMRKVYSIFVLRLGGRLWDSTDNIIISSIIGTIYVGINSNYILLMSSVVGILNTVRSSFVASIGNINATEKIETRYKIYRNLELLNSWITSFFAVCFYHLLNPFITLWLGKEYLFSQPIVAVIVVNFFILSYIMVVLMFQETLGLFEYGRYRNLIGGIANIFLSLLLAKPFGVFGVLLATLICSLLITHFVFPRIVYRYGFKKPFKEYIYRYASCIIITSISIALISAGNLAIKELSWVTFLIKFLLCAVIPNFLYYVIYRNTMEYQWIREKIGFVYGVVWKRI